MALLGTTAALHDVGSALARGPARGLVARSSSAAPPSPTASSSDAWKLQIHGGLTQTDHYDNMATNPDDHVVSDDEQDYFVTIDATFQILPDCVTGSRRRKRCAASVLVGSRATSARSCSGSEMRTRRCGWSGRSCEKQRSSSRGRTTGGRRGVLVARRRSSAPGRPGGRAAAASKLPWRSGRPSASQRWAP
jgi:hypothetical protein